MDESVLNRALYVRYIALSIVWGARGRPPSPAEGLGGGPHRLGPTPPPWGPDGRGNSRCTRWGSGQRRGNTWQKQYIKNGFVCFVYVLHTFPIAISCKQSCGVELEQILCWGGDCRVQVLLQLACVECVPLPPSWRRYSPCWNARSAECMPWRWSPQQWWLQASTSRSATQTPWGSCT